MDKEKFAQAVELIKTARKDDEKTFILVHTNGNKEKARLFIHGDAEICQYLKGSKRHGWYLDTSDIIDILPVKHRYVDESVRFARNCDKVIAILTESGWWSNILENAKFLKEQGLEKCLQWQKDYWCFDIPFSEEYRTERKTRKESVPEKFSADTFEMIRHLKLEKMYFGTSNDWRHQMIDRAVEENRPLHFREEGGRFTGLSYDTSFEFNAENKKAWYSKEYRNCGNGHYYLALSPTHAAFYEDD